MKLYATIKNEKNSTRPARKGGDSYLEIDMTRGNKPHAKIILSETSDVIDEGGFVIEWPDGALEDIKQGVSNEDRT